VRTVFTIPKCRTALREARRVLRPGGSLLFVITERTLETDGARCRIALARFVHRSLAVVISTQIDALIRPRRFRIVALQNSRPPGLPTQPLCMKAAQGLLDTRSHRFRDERAHPCGTEPQPESQHLCRLGKRAGLGFWASDMSGYSFWLPGATGYLGW